MTGKEIRLGRITDRHSGRTVIVPMDHGVSSGPITGIADIRKMISMVAEGGANAVVIHKGIASRGQRVSEGNMGMIVHLSGSTSLSLEPNAKTIICRVEEAIKLGADAVSIHVNIGDGQENRMLTDLADVASTCSEWSMPLMAMIYPRGEKVKDEFDPEAIMHAARLGAELGADVVKVSYTGSPETFKKVVYGCQIPVVIAGGPKMSSDRDILEMVKGAVESGAAGTSIGRNVFQHRDPAGIVRAISMIVHENAEIDEALWALNSDRAVGQ